VTNLSFSIYGSLGATQYSQETDFKSHCCSFVPLFNIAILIFLVSCDLENDVKVKWLIWDKGHGRARCVAY